MMRLDQRTLHGAPIGRFRLQVLSSEQSPELARLVYFAHFFISELGGTPRTWCLSRGDRRVVKLGEVDHFKRDSVNEFEVQAGFPARSLGNSQFGIQTSSTRMMVSPSSELWAGTEGRARKGKAEIRRLNYQVRRDFVLGHQSGSYPSLLDMLIFRSKSRTDQDAKIFFDLVTKGLGHVGLDLVQYACGDFNRRTDDVLIQAERAQMRPSELGMTLDQGHQILIVNAALSRKLEAEIDPNQIVEVRVLSKTLTALLFADDFLASARNRGTFRPFIA